MTPATAFAIERLSHLSQTVRRRPRIRARGDSLALSEALGQAAMLLDEIAPAVAACKGGPEEAIVLEAACDARERHVELVRSIGLEIERIAKELERLSRSSKATARYGAARQGPRIRLLERSA